jgi:hypothetical protein
MVRGSFQLDWNVVVVPSPFTWWNVHTAVSLLGVKGLFTFVNTSESPPEQPVAPDSRNRIADATMQAE